MSDAISKVSSFEDSQVKKQENILTAFLCLTATFWLALSAILLFLLCNEKRRIASRERIPLPRLTTLKHEWNRGGLKIPTLRLTLTTIWLLTSGAVLGVAIMRFAFPVLNFPLHSGDQRVFHKPWPLGGAALCASLQINSQNKNVPLFLSLLPIDGITQGESYNQLGCQSVFRQMNFFNNPIFDIFYRDDRFQQNCKKLKYMTKNILVLKRVPLLCAQLKKLKM